MHLDIKFKFGYINYFNFHFLALKSTKCNENAALQRYDVTSIPSKLMVNFIHIIIYIIKYDRH